MKLPEKVRAYKASGSLVIMNMQVRETYTLATDLREAMDRIFPRGSNFSKKDHGAAKISVVPISAVPTDILENLVSRYYPNS